MLCELIIENVAVIEKANIDFREGFTCLTGETGAGKSIIIDSINAIMGERISKNIVRTGADKASIVAVFENLEQSIIDKALEMDINSTYDHKAYLCLVVKERDAELTRNILDGLGYGNIKELKTKTLQLFVDVDSNVDDDIDMIVADWD